MPAGQARSREMAIMTLPSDQANAGDGVDEGEG